MKKRTLLSMAMVATMMMSTFVGCGGGRDGATDTSSAETATETTTEAAADAEDILRAYLDSYDHSDDNGQWFDKIREIAVSMGYAAKPKDFKKHPEDYKGHVGHVSTVIRIALMGRAQSPDVWAIQQIMGEEMVRARIGAALNA